MAEPTETLALGRHKVAIVLKSALIGGLVGVVVAAYRWLLERIEGLVSAVYAVLRGDQAAWLAPWFLGLAALGLGLGWLVGRFSLTSGSGIPQVVAVIKGYLSGRWLSTLLAKFGGGAAAMLSGLSLGREGPCIQMGACLADGVGRKLARSPTERMVLVAGGASAGLSAAFGAPLAGTLFCFEEIFRYLSPLTLLSTTVAAVAADYVVGLILGTDPVLDFPAPYPLPLASYWLLLALGLALGLIGACYNRCLIGLQTRYGQLMAGHPWLRPVPVLLLAGVVGLVWPTALGGGHLALVALLDHPSLGFLAVLLVVKFAFSVISFASGVPGGILFPLLTIGAITGALVGTGAVRWLGANPASFSGFILVAMAGCFAAIVRAPITGILLLTEMTGSFVHFLPLTLVAIVAYITAEVLKSEPVYASLLRSLLRRSQGLASPSGKLEPERPA